MARQVGNDFSIHLTASLRAATKALAELHAQGHISTTNWFSLKTGPIIDQAPQSGTVRTVTFTLEGNQKIVVQVMIWANNTENPEEEKNRWFPVHVYVQNEGVMQSFENHVGGRPWGRQPDCDKPLTTETE